MASILSSIASSEVLSVRACPCCGDATPQNWMQAPDRFHGRSQRYQLVRCPSCALVRLANPPLPSEMGHHYGPDYDRAISAAGEDPNHWRERRDALLKHKASGAILDLGCSSGGFLSSLKGGSWKLCGIEMSEEVANRARARSGAEVFVGDILDAPFPEGSFDAITCFHVFEHLYLPREVLQKVSNWLKPGGVFFTMMPNIESAGARIFRDHWYALELPRHLTHFSPSSLRTLGAAVGLREVSITTHREVFIEASVRYLFDSLCHRLGISREPLAKAKAPSFVWKVIRKMFRLTILPILATLASLAGDGESIHAVFQKPRAGSGNRADLMQLPQEVL